MKKNLYRFALTIFAIISIFIFGRIYFRLTDGFTVKNISSDFVFQPDWEVASLTTAKQPSIQKILDQTYTYLAKGCQSYVFVSEDKKYVIKFFKYQRFRIQPWLEYFPPLPAVVKYKQEKVQVKWEKLNEFMRSWKLAFDYLKEESGLVFVHLNKTNHLQKELVIYDKLGLKYNLDLDQMEFCVQKYADLLENVLLDYKNNNDLLGAEQLIQKLLDMTLLEYSRGIVDNDHALMQNTGVVDGNPVHIDVGQFKFQKEAITGVLLQEELFTKTYRLKMWMKEYYPELFLFLDQSLRERIGTEYDLMQPVWRKNSRRDHLNFNFF